MPRREQTDTKITPSAARDIKGRLVEDSLQRGIGAVHQEQGRDLDRVIFHGDVQRGRREIILLVHVRPGSKHVTHHINVPATDRLMKRGV